MRGTFRSFGVRNFRLWSLGILISSVGSWMQMTAQDWLVLTDLTDHDAVALGTLIALQFVPHIVLSPIAGVATDRWSPRAILLTTQMLQFSLAMVLGVLVLTGLVQLWHVYVLALVLGCVSAFDGPARNTFIVELVSDDLLPNGISLTAATFNCARLLGPAAAGIAIAAVGSGWVFVLNALTFIGVGVCLIAIRTGELIPRPPRSTTTGGLGSAVTYMRRHPETLVLSAVAFLIGMFSLNAAVVTATMARITFNVDAEGFGLLATMLGLGSMIGSLLSAAMSHADLRLIATASAAFAALAVVLAFAPTYWFFAVTLALFAIPMLVVMVAANARVQLVTDPQYRGRVIGIYMAIFMSGAPIGGPVLGAIVNQFGPPAALTSAAAAGGAASLIVTWWIFRSRRAASQQIYLAGGIKHGCD